MIGFKDRGTKWKRISIIDDDFEFCLENLF
jgi:hypothetical protein